MNNISQIFLLYTNFKCFCDRFGKESSEFTFKVWNVFTNFDRFCDDVYIFSLILLLYSKPKLLNVKAFKVIVQELKSNIL